MLPQGLQPRLRLVPAGAAEGRVQPRIQIAEKLGHLRDTLQLHLKELVEGVQLAHPVLKDQFFLREGLPLLLLELVQLLQLRGTSCNVSAVDDERGAGYVYVTAEAVTTPRE